MCVCKSCNYDDQDSSCADTLLLSMNHNEEYSDIKCRMPREQQEHNCLLLNKNTNILPTMNGGNAGEKICWL